MADAVVEPVVEPVIPVAPVVPAVEVHPATVVEPVVTPVVEPVVAPIEPVVDPVAEGAMDCTGFKFNGQDVTVEVPSDLREELTGKGINVNDVVKELYTSEDFSLTDATKESLYKVFGKSMVDSYLLGLKAQNEGSMRTHADGLAADEAANTVAWNETVEQVGGEDNWTALEAWAQTQFTDEQFKEFNSVMESGSRYAQKLAIADLMARHSAKEGDSAPNLVTGERVPPVSKDGALDYTTYVRGFGTPAQKADPAAWDARRRAGMAQGI